MRWAYFDCASGISGDMTLGALVDAGADLATIQAGITSLGLTNCRLVASEVKKRGFRATHISVEHEPEHAHRHLHHITDMISGSALSARQQQLAVDIFQRLAEAEAKVHGTTIEKVHFHEVGAVDSIADIVGTAIGWDLLGIDRAACSPLPTGHGFIEIAHGRTSLPAPATAELLRGVPLAASDTEGELTTPTGAAIATTLANHFGPLPAMRIDAIGCGAGTADFQHPNLLRLYVGQAPTSTPDATAHQFDSVVVLETNLDDCPAEVLGYCQEKLWASGALDVVTYALQMKKQRPGVALEVQARPDDAQQLADIILTETTALGLRRTVVQRTTLPRESVEVETAWGRVRGVVCSLPTGSQRFSPEFEACRELAAQTNRPLQEIYAAAERAFTEQAGN